MPSRTAHILEDNCSLSANDGRCTIHVILYNCMATLQEWVESCGRVVDRKLQIDLQLNPSKTELIPFTMCAINLGWK